MNRVKELRKGRGLTQWDLAKLLNVQRETISKYETGKIPITGDTIVALAEYFEVNSDYLLGKTDIPYQIPGDIPYPVMLMDDPVSAGLGMILQNGNDFTWINAIDAPEGTSFALRVRGDSMEPVYGDGDIVFVQNNVIVESGSIGVFILNGDGYLKRLQGDKLISCNTDYAPIRIGEYDSFYPVGRVIGAQNKE